MASTQQSIEINATPKQCFDIVKDFENYPKIMKEISDVEVESAGKNKFHVTYTINLIKKIQYTVEITCKSPSRISWTFVDGDMMKDNNGSWDFEELEKGLTLATYTIEVKFGLLVPGSVAKKLISSTLPAMLKSFKKAIEASASKKKK